MIVFRNTDIDTPFLWETGAQPPARWHGAGEGPAQYFSSTPEAAWAEFLFHRTNPKGLHAERWRHAHGCGQFFNALRDTVTDRFAAIYKAGEPKPDATSLRKAIP